MLLLRVGDFAKCLSRRCLFEKYAVRASFADCCQLCVSRRNGALRRVSETPLWLQRRNVTFVIPKTEDGKKRVLEQSQLLDVLEARIHQLQSDVVLDVQHAKVQFVKAPSSGRGCLSDMGPIRNPSKKTIPKSAPAFCSSKPSRWMQRLSEENIRKLNQQQLLIEKLRKKMEKKVQAKKLNQSLKKVPCEDGQKKRVTNESKELKNSLNQQHSEGTVSEDILLNIQCYLECCVFAGKIERAYRFLLVQHRNVTRRKHLNTDIYNIMMKVWAKRGSLSQIGRMFIMLEELGLKPNAGSYCAVLECMGRNPDCTPEIVTRCLNQMKKNDVSVDDVFSQCVFRQDEGDMVLKAVRIVQPDYQPNCQPHSLNKNEYSSPLVKDFYAQKGDYKYPKLDLTQKELQKRFKRQLSIEQACTITIESVETSKPVTENIVKMRGHLANHLAMWHKILLQALRESRKNLVHNTDIRFSVYPYLCLLEDEEYVDIMIQTIAKMPLSGGTLMYLAAELGQKIYSKYAVKQKLQNHIMDKLANIYNDYTELLAKDTKVYNDLPRERWCKLEMENFAGPTLQAGETNWPYIVTVELGTFLVNIMVKNLKINCDILNPSHSRKLIPILYHMYTFRSTRQIGFIKPHPILSHIQQEAMQTTLTFDSNVMPMLCPPVPWCSVKFGAYLLTPTKLMRAMEGATQHEKLLEKSQNLHPVLDSLNQLGNCAWKINKPVLDIIISIFNDRGCENLDIPPPLSEAPKVTYSFDPTHTVAEKVRFRQDMIEAKKKTSEMHSMRMDALYKLSIANHLRDEIFWFPHNMDFRGRTYPCPPYLNHLGSDVTRAILLFAEGKPLGPKGLDWLKIHLVNLTGLKKNSSLQGRLEYASTIMEDILDSADNPLNGGKWWMNADEPWQALACCMEIANAVRSPDPTQFISHFPVHQDGSCNGLQHYAALGRDVIGATSVNLMPCELPQDVYSGVAQQVEELRAIDAQKNVTVAKVLEGFINRKVVKQTVMTVVYGVTRHGGRLQIAKRLKETDEFPKDHVWNASNYLVRLVFSGLKEMFTGTREIQDWLTASARLISKSGHTVQWMTPLGLPIIQPYHQPRNQVLKSALQHINININYDIKEMPDTVKQKNAFPPNFIHSLDSTHMMLTSLHCYSADLTFVSVHDCFWTHALTVDTMNKICREQFVALHSQPILQELSDFLLNQYCSSPPIKGMKKMEAEYQKLKQLLARVPQTGDFDLQQVKDSTYFFS
ncbi:DNA-directed RNA polymerase, mitochondrial isoform X2 [Morone saxatilis]|uniref:DNA-directed RNA polymerase, mitochondrial isoform X2 n=1 Tax=Morone saxatilis TaxID=34816 RepID=UPI0015E22F6E|nr:DNA-directed RNA polymerase, mitochondrial isoform X2 [Morone saxatilis]